MYQELEFYKQYHRNSINRIIHFLCIPMIIVSIIIFFNNFYISYNKKNEVIYKVKFSDFIISLYTLSYLSISTDIGITMLFYFIFLRYVANTIIFYYNYNRISFYLFFLGWTFQFIGHFIEGKRPAFIDSISQSFYQAPLFSLDIIFPKLLEF